jgi:nucleoside-diphosphate-sugar epimerase
MRIFILGVNGFIGNALVERILKSTNWLVTGIDIEKDRLEPTMLKDPRFEFYHGDMSISREWVEFQVKRCDVVLPLAAVAIPIVYIENPLLVFELDFLENLHIIQHAVKYKKRLIFPSTSEVYGMVQDEEFDEIKSNLTLGPVKKLRWIYSCSKQLLDRVIHAYSLQQGLQYTIFRPFNWIGPGLDRIHEEHKIGHSRVVTQFISDTIFNKPIHLVDGGEQRRCFTYLEDGIDGLMKILENNGGKADGRIFNLGNPDNDLSIRELASLLIKLYSEHPRSKKYPFTAGTNIVEGKKHYGEGYQDVPVRKPSIRKAKHLLGWEPKYKIEEALRSTLDWFLSSENNKTYSWNKW